MTSSFVSVRSPRSLGAAGLLVAFMTACGGESNTSTADSAGSGAARATTLQLGPQDVAVAAEAQIGDAILLSGPLQPSDIVVVRAQVAGTIADLRVDRGVAVRAGQQLANIRAAGVVSQAAGARAGVAAAEANVVVARKQLEAARTLNAAGAMSDLDRQGAEAAFEAAQAQLAAAKAQAAAAGEAAGYTSVTAPISGVVSARRAENGESIKSGDEMLTIVDSRRLELSGQIGVAEASRVRVGQPVSFSLDAFPSETWQGRVARIDPLADPATRQVGVYVELANAGGRIVGGQFARGSISLGQARAVTVPQTAVQTGAADSAWVFVVSGGRLTRRAVTLGARDTQASTVAVRTGLKAGEQVLRTITADVTDGTPVRVTSPEAPRPDTPRTTSTTPSPTPE